jgi:hypothetical protein
LLFFGIHTENEDPTHLTGTLLPMSEAKIQSILYEQTNRKCLSPNTNVVKTATKREEMLVLTGFGAIGQLFPW